MSGSVVFASVFSAVKTTDSFTGAQISWCVLSLCSSELALLSFLGSLTEARLLFLGNVSCAVPEAFPRTQFALLKNSSLHPHHHYPLLSGSI